MTFLRQALAGYLEVRRLLGYKLEQSGKLLADFLEHLAQSDSPFITTSAALAFATRPAEAMTITWAKRLAVLRRFAQYVHTLDPRNEIPPAKILPYRQRRPTPYLYSEADLRALDRAARTLRASAFRRSTIATLIGLLAATGMRVGETLSLDCSDFDQREGVITIRAAKFRKSREVALHDTVVAALHDYEQLRNRIHRRPRSPAFFLSEVGGRLHRQNVSMAFSRVLRRAGLWNRKPRRPRLHDLRHSFVVMALIRWYREGINVEAQLPRLSTYLGHVCPSGTYWYLTAVPELVGLAAQRLEGREGTRT